MSDMRSGSPPSDGQVYVPIMTKNECWGVIAFDNCGKARLFNEEEIAVLKIAASSIAGAVELGEYIESLQRSEALYKSCSYSNLLKIYLVKTLQYFGISVLV